MQPPRGLNGRDSFSAYPKDDLFDHIRNHGKKPVALIDPSQLDRLEQAVPNKEMETLNRMLNQQASKPIHVLVKSGKFFIMVLILPAHMLLFKAPKWMISALLPKIVFFTQKIHTSLTETFNRLVQKIAMRMQVFAALKNSLKPLHSIIKSSLKKMMENFLSPFQKALAKVEETVKKVSDFISKKMDALHAVYKSISQVIFRSFDLAKKRTSAKRNMGKRQREIFNAARRVTDRLLAGLLTGWVAYFLLSFFKKLLRFCVLTLKWCRIMVTFTIYLIRESFRELNS